MKIMLFIIEKLRKYEFFENIKEEIAKRININKKNGKKCNKTKNTISFIFQWFADFLTAKCRILR